jgi:protein gp37
MAAGSEIEWTDATWNPVTGCTKVSAGCAHCYAERMAHRLQAMGQANYKDGFELTLQPHMLDIPLGWKSAKRIFVNSMSDLFHPDVPIDYIHRVFDVMSRAHWHQYQILTKRSERLREVAHSLPWPKQVWMGVTVESAKYRRRIDDLRTVPASTRFLSLEPLLSALPDLDLSGVDWVIVGGESGPGARPMNAAWVHEIKDQCLEQQVPFFFKQWGGVNKKRTGRELEGRVWNEFPSDDRHQSAVELTVSVK